MSNFKTKSSLWQQHHISSGQRYLQHQQWFNKGALTTWPQKSVSRSQRRRTMWSLLYGNGSYLIPAGVWTHRIRLLQLQDLIYCHLPDVCVDVNRDSVTGSRGSPPWACSGVRSGAHLQFLRTLVVQRLQWKVEVVVICQLSQVKIILGVDAGCHVDVKLQELQELTLHLIPAGGKSIWARCRTAVRERRRNGWIQRDSISYLKYWFVGRDADWS